MIFNLLAENPAEVSYTRQAIAALPHREGHPPSVGWWNASTSSTATDFWRYWDGCCWSYKLDWAEGQRFPSQRDIDDSKRHKRSPDFYCRWRNIQPPWGDA